MILCVCVCVFATEWVSKWATRITLTHETFNNTHTSRCQKWVPMVLRKAILNIWTSIWCNFVVQYSSPIGSWYIHLLRRSSYMSHSPTTSAEWNTAPIKKMHLWKHKWVILATWQNASPFQMCCENVFSSLFTWLMAWSQWSTHWQPTSLQT